MGSMPRAPGRPSSNTSLAQTESNSLVRYVVLPVDEAGQQNPGGGIKEAPRCRWGHSKAKNDGKAARNTLRGILPWSLLQKKIKAADMPRAFTCPPRAPGLAEGKNLHRLGGLPFDDVVAFSLTRFLDQKCKNLCIKSCGYRAPGRSMLSKFFFTVPLLKELSLRCRMGNGTRWGEFSVL